MRERAAYELGFDHGAADGLATFLRTQAPGQSKRAQHMADQVRALVVNANLTPHEAAHVLAETMWAILNKPPAPPFDG